MTEAIGYALLAVGALIVVGSVGLTMVLWRRTLGQWWPRCCRCRRRWLTGGWTGGGGFVEACDAETWVYEGVYCTDCLTAVGEALAERYAMTDV